MKKPITFLLLTAAISCSSAFAQELTEYERIYYSDIVETEAGDFTFSTNNCVAQLDNCKLALKIENKSSDFLMFVPKESTFKYSFGDKNPDVKPYYIAPDDKKTKTIKVDGGEQFRQRSFDYEVGGLYRIPLAGNTVEAPEFQLPANKNNFTAGNFKVVLKKYEASTREAKASFEVTYTGDDVGLVNAANLSVRAKRNKSEEEVVYANDDKKGEAEILHKGESAKFDAVFHIEGRIVDMQFATMYIIWNDTFVETKPEEIEPVMLSITVDETLTKEKK